MSLSRGTGIPLGINQTHERIVRLPERGNRSLYVIGASGAGKSTSMLNQMVCLNRKGCGFTYLDPHREGAQQLIGMIDEAIFLDFDDTHCPDLNLFAQGSQSIGRLATETANSFRLIFDTASFHRINHLLRMAIHSLYDFLQQRIGEVNEANAREHSPSLTFAEFADSIWKQYLDHRDIKPSTRYSYRSILERHVLPLFGRQALEDITPRFLSSFLAKLHNNNLSAQTRLNVYALLRTMFTVAVEHDLIAASPIRQKLHRPKVRRTEKPALSAEQMRLILAQIPGRYEALFACLAVTGLRIGELLALRWKNVDWEEAFNGARLATETLAAALLSPREAERNCSPYCSLEGTVPETVH